MKIFLTDQSKHFEEHLANLQLTQTTHYNKHLLVERRSSVTVSAKRSFAERDTSFLRDYRIFPPHIMSFLTQWDIENREMRLGDTIVQQVNIPAKKRFSLKVVFGVRICSIVNEKYRVGFGYQTLKGHVETGESFFTLYEAAPGKTVFEIHAFSRMNHVLSGLVAPFFSIPFLHYCRRQALTYVRRQLD